jgi:hypothetical protein
VTRAVVEDPLLAHPVPLDITAAIEDTKRRAVLEH